MTLKKLTKRAEGSITYHPPHIKEKYTMQDNQTTTTIGNPIQDTANRIALLLRQEPRAGIELLNVLSEAELDLLPPRPVDALVMQEVADQLEAADAEVKELEDQLEEVRERNIELEQEIAKLRTK